MDVGQHQKTSRESENASVTGSIESCLICGSALEYLEQSEGVVCGSCGKSEQGYIRCPQGHYLCEACHNRDSIEMIKETTLGTLSKDPAEIAESMMNHPKLPMLGCQHAYIAAGALLGALRNEGSRKITESDFKEVFKRIERQAVGGYCGLTGICGIVPAIGACFSILLGSTCGKDLEQRNTMEVTRRVMEAIEKLTGPSCCKAYVRASLPVAVDLLKRRLGISLPIKNRSIACLFDKHHPHGCRESKCLYYKKQGKD